jgi:fermentation-respiration switch protein FrsA (DUF1100 family)
MLNLLEQWLVFPAPRVNELDWQVTDLLYEDVYFDAADGTKLHGWYVPHPNPKAVVLYCHGNGEYVAQLAKRLKVLHERIGVTVFAWDYRGYGRSAGKPHEENLIADGRVALLWLANKVGLDPSNIVLIGRSLGGAVAVALAAEFNVRGLVLDRTFSVLTDAAAHNYPWLPVRLVMRNRFSSVERIKNYHGPLLQTHGTQDRIVPYMLGKKLFEAAPGKNKKFLTVEGGDHSGPLPGFCYDALVEFLDGLPKQSPVIALPGSNGASNTT